MKVKHNILGHKLAAVCRRNVLPMDPFADMHYKSRKVGEFPTFCQMSSDIFIGTFAFPEIIDRRVHRPIQSEHFFHPGGVDLGQMHPIIRVKIRNPPVSPDI